MNDIEKRLERWLAHMGLPTRRTDPDHKFGWLVYDALEEIRKLRAQGGKAMNASLVSQVVEIGRDAYGRRVTATRKRTYDGKTLWEIISAPVSQRDDGERMSGLTDENMRTLADALRLTAAQEAKP